MRIGTASRETSADLALPALARAKPPQEEGAAGPTTRIEHAAPGGEEGTRGSAAADAEEEQVGLGGLRGSGAVDRVQERLEVGELLRVERGLDRPGAESVLLEDLVEVLRRTVVQ